MSHRALVQCVMVVCVLAAAGMSWAADQAACGGGAAQAEKAVSEAPAPAAAQEITIEGVISRLSNEDGSVKAIYINPAEGHGYRVDLKNGKGMELGAFDGKKVKATGMDVDRYFNITSYTILEQ